MYIAYCSQREHTPGPGQDARVRARQLINDIRIDNQNKTNKHNHFISSRFEIVLLILILNCFKVNKMSCATMIRSVSMPKTQIYWKDEAEAISHMEMQKMIEKRN